VLLNYEADRTISQPTLNL